MCIRDRCYHRILELLHRDLAPEQKTDKITQLNCDLKVGDSWSEAGQPNKNPVEQGGVRILKTGIEGSM